MGGGLLWPTADAATPTERELPTAGPLDHATSDAVRVERGSDRAIPVDCLTADGRVLIHGVQLAAVRRGWRGSEPPAWQPTVLVNGRTCLMTRWLEPGRYQVQATDGQVVVTAGTLLVT